MTEADVDAWREQFQVPDAAELADDRRSADTSAWAAGTANIALAAQERRRIYGQPLRRSFRSTTADIR